MSSRDAATVRRHFGTTGKKTILSERKRLIELRVVHVSLAVGR
jgi:hypothetical protein